MGNLVATGQPFFDWVCRELASAQDIAYVHIGEVTGEAWDRMSILSGLLRSAPIVPCEYELRGTPCETALTENGCRISDEVTSRYPTDEILASVGARAFYGVPLRDVAGHALGLISIWHDEPITDFHALDAAVARLRDRLVGELEMRSALRERAALIEGTTLPSSKSVFDGLAKTLARAMRVKVAIIAQLLRDRPGEFGTLGLVVDGQPQPPVYGPTRNCPCGALYEIDGVLSIPSGLQTRFPSHEPLSAWNAQSYIGLAFSDADGKPMGHVAVIHDKPIHDRPRIHELLRMVAIRASFELGRHRVLEERVALERNLLEAQRLESLGLLAGGVAHDFNNLLVGILGNASLARAELDPAAPAQPYLSSIELAGRQAADLARQMLAYSGRGKLEVRSIDANALTEETVALVQRSISRRVTIHQQLATQALIVAGDSSQIRQVVMNLVINAAEAIGDAEGRIDIESAVVTVGEGEVRESPGSPSLPPGRYAMLLVRDTGRGMDPTTKARIFEPFFTTKFTGRGLGLAAVHGIVRSHGGVIVVASELGKGSTFRVYIPSSASADSPLSPPRHPNGMHAFDRPGKILVIDDEAMVRDTAGRMLTHLGLEPVLAIDGDSGIASFKVHRETTHCVLLDMTMPGKNGVEVLRELRRIDPSARIVIMTGFDESDCLRKFDRDAPSGFLGKPFQIGELRAQLDSVIPKIRVAGS